MNIVGFEFGSLQSLQVYRAHGFRVIDGANPGEPITIADDLIAGDVYHLSPAAERLCLDVTIRPGAAAFEISRGSPTGRDGAILHIDCCVTLMSPDGTTLEALVLVEVDRGDGSILDVYLFPMAAMKPRIQYALIAIDTRTGLSRFAESCCVSFTRKARITMASGKQVAVEHLREGDQVLTRDHGAQPISWIGHNTVRAVGDFAPIRIRAGAFCNRADLLVSPNHGLYIPPADRPSGACADDTLVKARDLLNGDTVAATSGGFVEYFQMLFERHEVIYAEGIPVETLLLDQATRPALPERVFRRFSHSHKQAALGRDERKSHNDVFRRRADRAANG